MGDQWCDHRQHNRPYVWIVSPSWYQISCGNGFLDIPLTFPMPGIIKWSLMPSFKSYTKILRFFWIAVYHGVFPFSLSIAKDSSTYLGTRIPNLCVVHQYLAFTLDIILLQCLIMSHIQHLQAGYISRRFPSAYSDNFTGLDSFKYLRGIQLEETSDHK